MESFPTEPGKYKATITAAAASTVYTGTKDSADFKIIDESTPVAYRKWNGTKIADAEPCTDYNVITDQTEWTDGTWYVLKDDITISSRITVNGTVNLILCDGAALTASKGIVVAGTNTLNIYAQIHLKLRLTKIPINFLHFHGLQAFLNIVPMIPTRTLRWHWLLWLIIQHQWNTANHKRQDIFLNS